MVERFHGKEKVTGSNPVFGSVFSDPFWGHFLFDFFSKKYYNLRVLNNIKFMLKLSQNKGIRLFFSLVFSSIVFLALGNNAMAIGIDNPLKVNDVPTLIGNVINYVLGIVGSLALVMFIYGGIVWMTAAGNEKSIDKGKNILMWAALGLAVIFLSYALTRFVLQVIGA